MDQSEYARRMRASLSKKPPCVCGPLISGPSACVSEHLVMCIKSVARRAGDAVAEDDGRLLHEHLRGRDRHQRLLILAPALFRQQLVAHSVSLVHPLSCSRVLSHFISPPFFL